MSNRRRPQPPAAVCAYAASYRCGDCDSETAEPRQDEHGLWHIDISHDDHCPVLAGTIPTSSAGIATALNVVRSGHNLAYLNIDPDTLNP